MRYILLAFFFKDIKGKFANEIYYIKYNFSNLNKKKYIIAIKPKKFFCDYW